MLTLRCRRILQILLAAAVPIKVRSLKEEFKVSERTVKYDIETMRGWLERETDGAVQLVNRPRQGFLLEGEIAARERVRALLSGETTRDAVLHPEERVRQIALLLLLANDFMTLERLAEELQVSKNTVSMDLAGVTDFFLLRNIVLERKAHWGLRVRANEIKRRLAIEYLVLRLLDGKDTALLLQNLREGSVPTPISQILRRFFLEEREVDAAYEAFAALLRWLGTRRAGRLDDRVAMALLARLCVMIARLKQNAALPEEAADGDLSKALLPAVEVLRRLLTRLELTAGAREFAFLILPFAELGNETLAPDLARLVTRLIRHVGRLSRTAFESDGDLFENLLSHLKERIVRHRYGAMDPNPLLESVRHYYGALFRAVGQVAHDVLGARNVLLQDEDIAYLTLHFQASYERRCGKLKFRALIVCGTGRGSAKLLKARLENECGDLHVTGCCPLLELEEALRWQPVDLIVSVLPIQTELPHVVVSALLNEREVEAVRAKLTEIKSAANGEAGLPELPSAREAQPQLELLSQEIISKGFQLGILICETFRPYLNRQSETGLMLHCLLMANRLTFHSPYVDFGGGRRVCTPERQRIIAQLKRLAQRCFPAVPDSELYAILNYFALEEENDA